MKITIILTWGLGCWEYLLSFILQCRPLVWLLGKFSKWNDNDSRNRFLGECYRQKTKIKQKYASDSLTIDPGCCKIYWNVEERWCHFLLSKIQKVILKMMIVQGCVFCTRLISLLKRRNLKRTKCPTRIYYQFKAYTYNRLVDVTAHIASAALFVVTGLWFWFSMLAEPPRYL